MLPVLCFSLSPGFHLSSSLPMVLDLNRPLIPLQTNMYYSDQRPTAGARRRSVYRTVAGSTPLPHPSRTASIQRASRLVSSRWRHLLSRKLKQTPAHKHKRLLLPKATSWGAAGSFSMAATNTLLSPYCYTVCVMSVKQRLVIRVLSCCSSDGSLQSSSCSQGT